MDGGPNFHYTSRTDAGAWTDVTTQRPWMGLELLQIDASSGGNGGEVSFVSVVKRKHADNLRN